MNILKWLKDRGGKMAVSALQAAGIATVVGVAGIGAYSVLSSPAEDTSLSPSSYNPGEVVYVAGNPNSGVYQSGAYSTGAEGGSALNQSSAHFTAKTLSRIEQQENRERAMAEMEEYEANSRPSSSTGESGYQFSNTEGLGMGSNVANEMGLAGGNGGNDPMAAVSGMMGNMQGVINQAQQQAQAQGQAAQGKEGEAGKAGANGLKAASMATSGSGSGGGAFNSTYAIQNSGKNAKGAEQFNAPDVGNVISSAQEQMAKSVEGAKLQGKASFGRTDKLESNKDATIMNVRNTKDGKDLKWMMERSNKVAMTKSRAANEASAPFLASTKVSGGMHIAAENVTTGQGQGSKDFSADAVTSLRGIKSWGLDTQLQEDKVQRARDRLRQMMWTTIPAVLVLAFTISLLVRAAMHAPKIFAWIFWALAAVVTAVALVMCGLLIAVAKQYIDIRGSGSSLSTWGIVAGGVLMAVTGLAWIPGIGDLISDKAAKWLLPVFGSMAGIGGVTGVIQGSKFVKEGNVDKEALSNEQVDENPEK